MEHIELKQSLSLDAILYVKYTKVQYSHSFSDSLSEDESIHIWGHWEIHTIIINCISQSAYLFPNSLHIFTKKEEMTDFICLVAV